MIPAHLTPRQRLTGIALFAVLFIAAGAITWWATRSPAVVTAGGGMSAAEHAAMTAGTPGDAPRSVQIPAADARRIGVTFVAVAAAPASRDVRMVGSLTVDETRQVAVSLKVDGWVERLWVDFAGRHVRRGEPMLELYAPALVSAQEELLLAHRLSGTLASGGADAAGSDAARGASSLVESARRRLRLWDVADSTIRRVERTGIVEKTVIFAAPASGVVTDKNVVAGQQVMAGQTLLRLADLSMLWLDGEVFEQDLSSVRVGQLVEAEFSTLPGEVRRGRVSYVYPTLDPTTRTARVRVAMANADGRLSPGMSATIRLSTTGHAAALSIPRRAVLSTGERRLVFVKRADGALEPRDVILGVASDDRVEVLRGLALGDTVVASATFLVDAESNLGSAMSGMAGMQMSPPTKPAAKRGAPQPH